MMLRRDLLKEKLEEFFKENYQCFQKRHFVIDWSGFRGRDEDYYQFHLKSTISKVEMNFLFWFVPEPDELSITYSCFERLAKDEIKYIFKNELNLGRFKGLGMKEKMMFLFEQVDSDLATHLDKVQ
ncbi:MAG: hypothetical protein ABUL44_01080 [Flavobacterium sp.]